MRLNREHARQRRHRGSRGRAQAGEGRGRERCGRIARKALGGARCVGVARARRARREGRAHAPRALPPPTAVPPMHKNGVTECGQRIGARAESKRKRPASRQPPPHAPGSATIHHPLLLTPLARCTNSRTGGGAGRDPGVSASRRGGTTSGRARPTPPMMNDHTMMGSWRRGGRAAWVARGGGDARPRRLLHPASGTGWKHWGGGAYPVHPVPQPGAHGGRWRRGSGSDAARHPTSLPRPGALPPRPALGAFGPPRPARRAPDRREWRPRRRRRRPRRRARARPR